MLVGALSFSGRCRGVICKGMTFAHLTDAIDSVLRRLGGTTRAWRTDRMATVVHPGTDRITGQFAQAAKHYGDEHGSIILTTNRGIASWGEIFEDTTVAAAILDRLLYHATVLQIDGDG